MKNRILLFGIVGIVASAFFACEKKVEITTEKTVSINKDSIKSAIEALEAGYMTAMNAGNADGVADYYADDATSFPADEAPLVGKAAIRESIAKQIKEAPKGLKVSFITNEIMPSNDGNQVVEVGSYKVVDSAGTKMYSGNFIGVFEKRDGKYVCVRDIAVSDMPKEKK